MKLEKLAMPPFSTTLMGVVKGALDYYQIEASAPTVFGVSGHAFLINIHEQLCPSGPYCWNPDAASPLLRNLGVEITDLGFFYPQSSAEDRAAVERRLRDALDRGMPCSLLNMEHQLIAGYDDDGLLTLQPWGQSVELTPARLTFGSWQEFGDTFHVSFYTLKGVQPAEHLRAVLDSLDYAVDLHSNPAKHSLDGYGIGPEAYANWINAAAQFGGSHGNWWNATVWSECRQMASSYLVDIRQRYGGPAQSASEAARIYAEIAGALERLRDKNLEAAEKAKLLAETKEKESQAVGEVAALAESLRSASRG